MYRTRQQFPSFMGVYIPPCSNVESSVNICISNVATVCTTEVLAVSNANVTTFMASLRSICRRDGGYFNAIHLALIFKGKNGADRSSKSYFSYGTSYCVSWSSYPIGYSSSPQWQCLCVLSLLSLQFVYLCGD